MAMKKIFFFAAVLFIVLALLFLVLQIDKNKIPTQIGVSPTDLSTTSNSTVDSIKDWKTYYINANGLAFKYPSNKEVSNLDFENSDYIQNILEADEEYWVALPGSDQIFLEISLYKSTKNPESWWISEGKEKYEKLADGWKTNNPPINVSVKYEVNNITIADKEAISVSMVVHSDGLLPWFPGENLIIFQNKGYITTVSYGEVSENSLDLSRRIISTFKFTD